MIGRRELTEGSRAKDCSREVMPMPSKIDLTNVDVMALQKALTPRLTKYIPYEPTPKQRAFLLMNDVKEILYGG